MTARRSSFVRWAVAAAAVGWLTAILGIAPPVAAQATVPEPARSRSSHPALASSLQDDVEAGEPVRPVTALGTGALDVPAGTPVTVVVEADDPAAARAAVEAVGGSVTIELEDRVQADVPATSLLEVVGAPGVRHVREPNVLIPATTSEGVAQMGASAWQGAGWQGTGVKVAVLDTGFDGHAAQIGAAGELGEAVTTDLSRCEYPEANPHGTAVAEVVHDVVPGASLHLVCVDTEEGFISALQSMAAQGVDIVSGAVTILGAGRGDGTGAAATTVAGALRTLRAQDVLYVAPAGNYRVDHWHGPAVGDGGTGDYVDLVYGDAMPFSMDGTGDLGMVTAVWDEWTGPRTDFDLYVYHPSCPATFLGFSEFDQGAGARPVEFTIFERCGSHTSGYQIYVNRYAGTGRPRLDLYLDLAATAPFPVTASSIPEPGSSPAVFTVGAHCASYVQNNGDSGMGPTIDGRQEPDLTAPDSVSTATYGDAEACTDGFTGTSAAVPHAAGAAALLLGASPDLEVAELERLLVDRAQSDGFPWDPVRGHGRLTMGAAGSAATPSPLAFTPMVPVRLYDTRPGQLGAAEAPARGTPVGSGQMLQVPVRGVAGVPADAVAVALNVTVVSPTANGHLTVQPEATPPTTSNLNFRAGQTVAQQVTATVGSANSVRVFNAAGNSHVIVDVTGWYGPNEAPAVPATDGYTALPSPMRMFDSRAAWHGAEPVNRTTRLASGEQVVMDLSGAVPPGASAAIVNLTAAQGTTGGHLTAFPTGAAAPTTSNLNFGAGQNIANLAVVPLDAQERMTVRSEGSTHVVVDVIGWFHPDGGAGYVPLTRPTRVLDTRQGMGLRRIAITPTNPHDQFVGRYAGVPADAEAVYMSVVAVAPTANSHLSVFPTGGATVASTLNFLAGRTVPNAVVSGLGTQGRARFTVAAGTVHLVADVSGYFLDPANVPVPLASPP